MPDVSTVRNTLADLAMLKIDLKNVVLVTDRGYGSKANWEDMLLNHMSFVRNARLNLNGAIKETIDAHYQELLNWNSTVSFIRQNAVTVPVIKAIGEKLRKCEEKQNDVHNADKQ